MKILLDENLDHRLRSCVGAHDVFTASFMGFSGLKNGNLLDAANQHNFDVLLTGDQTLRFEQNLAAHRIAVVVLSSVEWRLMKHHLPAIAEAVNRAAPGSLQFVDCGAFTRKR